MKDVVLSGEQILGFLRQTFTQMGEQTVALTKLADAFRDLAGQVATREQLADIRGAVGGIVENVTQFKATFEAQEIIVRSILDSLERDKQHVREMEKYAVEDRSKRRKEFVVLVAKVAGWILMGGGVSALLVERLL